MRLLFFNRSFHPDVEATGQLLTELCEDLSVRHDVTVVAGRPYNLDRFGSWWPVRRERLGAVTILRAYNPRLNKRRFVGRVINLFSYFCFSFVAGFLARRPDVVIVETDPPVLGLVALCFAKLYRAKFVFYLQDLYPDLGIALGKLKNPVLLQILAASTRRILASADRVVVLGEDMQRRVEATGYPHRDRIRVVSNWVDTDRIRSQRSEVSGQQSAVSGQQSAVSGQRSAVSSRPNPFRQQHGLTDRFVVMFSGNLGLSQGLDQVLDVVAALRDRGDIRFIFIGEGAAKSRLVTKATALGLPNVLFLPYQPKEKLSESLGAADLHLVTLRRGLAGLIVPSKVYGIMAVGRPFIAAIEADSHVADIVRQHQCGVRVEPDSPDQLKSAILWAVEHRAKLREMGERGRETAVRYFDRPVSVAKFQSLLDELSETRTGTGRRPA